VLAEVASGAVHVDRRSSISARTGAASTNWRRSWRD